MAVFKYFNETTQSWENIQTEQSNTVLPNTQSWISSEGQTTFTVSNGSIVDEKLLRVIVGGVPQSNILLIDSYTFQLSEALPSGVKVDAEWFEVKVPVSTGHKVMHEIGGSDELDITKLKYYKENIQDKIAILDSKTTGLLHAKELGLLGDGSDETIKLQDAINLAQTTKKQLVLEAGKTYLITAPLNITASCSIVSDAQNRATIRTQNQDFNPIEVTGIYMKETTLSASATVNTKWLDVVSGSGIQPSMLIEVISSKSWYHDPRPESTDCRKAEVHRVDEVIGNRIYTTDPLFDGYDLTKETVTIKVYTPIRCHMANINIQMTKSPVPNDNIRKTGLTLRHTIDAILDNIYVTNAQNCGIFLYHSYRPKIIGGRSEGANNYFSGYGVQTWGTTHALIKDRDSRNCRRAVDVSGGSIPSHFTVIEGCSAFGSGTNSMGERYGYNDDHTTGTYAGGFGTHGGADHTIIRDNYLGFLHYGIIDRSRNTIIENNYFVGDFRNACIDVSFGINGIIRGNKAYDGFTALKENTVFDGGANVNTRKAPIFIRYQDTALSNGSSGGFFVVEDNFVMVQSTFIEFYSDSTVVLPTQSNFIIKDNHCYFAPQNGSEDCVFIKNSLSGVPIILASGSKVKENTIKRLHGTGGILYYQGVDIRNASEIESPRSFSFYLLDDSSEHVDTGAGGTSMYMRVLLDCAFTSGMFRLIRGSSGVSSWIGDVVSNINGYGTALTGTTGTDGKINLAFLPNGKLYVENRSGSTQRITVTLMNYI